MPTVFPPAQRLAEALWDECRTDEVYRICEEHLKAAQAAGYAQGVRDTNEAEAQRLAEALWGGVRDTNEAEESDVR